jgi:hypothetical protein
MLAMFRVAWMDYPTFIQAVEGEVNAFKNYAGLAGFILGVDDGCGSR